MISWEIVACITIAGGAAGCGVSGSSAQVIKGYEGSKCVAPSAHRRVEPRAREWQSTLSLHDGSEVVVSGADVPGGRIAITYPATRRQVLAADAGDYVYPSDVRLDAQNDLLYVRAHGLGGGLFEQTWLFEYDIDRQRLVKRERVSSALLPAECPDQDP